MHNVFRKSIVFIDFDGSLVFSVQKNDSVYADKF